MAQCMHMEQNMKPHFKLKQKTKKKTRIQVKWSKLLLSTYVHLQYLSTSIHIKMFVLV